MPWPLAVTTLCYRLKMLCSFTSGTPPLAITCSNQQLCPLARHSGTRMISRVCRVCCAYSCTLFLLLELLGCLIMQWPLLTRRRSMRAWAGSLARHSRCVNVMVLLEFKGLPGRWHNTDCRTQPDSLYIGSHHDLLSHRRIGGLRLHYAP